MRPKIVIAILLSGVAGIAVVFFLKPPAARLQPAEAPVSRPAAQLPKAVAAIPHPVPAVSAPAVAAPSQSKNPVTVATGEVVDEEADKVQEQIDRLVDLQSNDDAESLHAILNELTNTNKIIRHEAIEATIQFGSRDAIPVLNDLAARAQDPDEKKELLEAAAFLALPTLTEAREQARQEKRLIVPPPVSDQP